jgi:hypothetical protein
LIGADWLRIAPGEVSGLDKKKRRSEITFAARNVGPHPDVLESSAPTGVSEA